MVARISAIFAAILLIGVCFGQVDAAKTVSISGRVKAPATGEGIRDAQVTLTVPGRFASTARRYTRRDGTFAFVAVPAQKYELEIRVPGFKLLRKEVDAGGGRDIETGDLYPELSKNPGDIVTETDPKYPARDVAQFVVDMLDVTSFPNSIGPRRAKGKATFRDYGVVPRRIAGNEAVLEESDGSWTFVITILKRTDLGIGICFEHRGAYPAHYHTQEVLLLTRPDSKSMLTAAESDADFKECPVLKK